jgi:hypothetical protein
MYLSFSLLNEFGSSMIKGKLYPFIVASSLYKAEGRLAALLVTHTCAERDLACLS